MPKIKDSFTQDKLQEMVKEVQNEPQATGGFLKSYKEFLDKWGSYRKANSPKSKPTGRPRHAVFKVTLTQYE